jgi:hypothetical protein
MKTISMDFDIYLKEKNAEFDHGKKVGYYILSEYFSNNITLLEWSKISCNASHINHSWGTILKSVNRENEWIEFENRFKK